MAHIPASSRRTLKPIILWGLAGLALAAALWTPATTRQGVDFELRTVRQPLFLKAMDFVDRHFHYRTLAREITQGASTDEERVRRIFEWTHEHIRPVPGNLPIVDDHIWHIIIRGYGTEDQANDVFATLCVYAGVPAFWTWLPGPGVELGLVLSFVTLDGRQIPLDPYHGRIFTKLDGSLADREDLIRDPSLMEQGFAPLIVHGVPYGGYAASLRHIHQPQPPRAQLQMPLYRLWYEVSRRCGIWSFSA